MIVSKKQLTGRLRTTTTAHIIYRHVLHMLIYDYCCVQNIEGATQVVIDEGFWSVLLPPSFDSPTTRYLSYLLVVRLFFFVYLSQDVS
jgi:hypothetical protein